jgi:hypothetical protein
MKMLEKILQNYFKSLDLHIIYDGGTEFLKNDIIKLVISFLQKINIKFKVLSRIEINNLIRKWLLKKIDDNNSDIDTLINTPQVSPFWTRLFGHLPSGLKKSDSRCDDIFDVLKIWGEDKDGLKGMVVGHTPQIDKGINSTCDDSVWRVDLGASKAFDVFDRIKNSGRKPAVLEIVKDGKEFNILS